MPEEEIVRCYLSGKNERRSRSWWTDGTLSKHAQLRWGNLYEVVWKRSFYEVHSRMETLVPRDEKSVERACSSYSVCGHCGTWWDDWAGCDWVSVDDLFPKKLRTRLRNNEVQSYHSQECDSGCSKCSKQYGAPWRRTSSWLKDAILESASLMMKTITGWQWQRSIKLIIYKKKLIFFFAAI